MKSTICALVIAGLLAIQAPMDQAEAAGRPDLVVTSVRTPGTVSAGSLITTNVTVRNRGFIEKSVLDAQMVALA